MNNITLSETPAQPPPTTTPATVPTPPGCQPTARQEPLRLLRFPSTARHQLQLLVETINRYNDSPTDLLNVIIGDHGLPTETDPAVIAAATIVRQAMHLVAAVNAVNRVPAKATTP